jgi:hypothetical protein
MVNGKDEIKGKNQFENEPKETSFFVMSKAGISHLFFLNLSGKNSTRNEPAENCLKVQLKNWRAVNPSLASIF